jgi:hypothetical protein
MVVGTQLPLGAGPRTFRAPRWVISGSAVNGDTRRVQSKTHAAEAQTNSCATSNRAVTLAPPAMPSPNGAAGPRDARVGTPSRALERVAGLMRIPAIRHRRHRLAATLPREALQRPDRTRFRYRLTPRPRPGACQPPQLLKRRGVENLGAAHGVDWGPLGSEVSSFPMS